MNPRIALALFGLGICLLIGAVTVVMLHNEPQSAAEAVETAGVLEVQASTTAARSLEDPPRAVPFNASLREVVASRKDYGCHYATSDNGSEITGTVFVSDGQARGTFVGTLPGTGDVVLWYFLMTPSKHAVWFVFPEDAPEGFRGKAYLHVETDQEEVEKGREDLLDDIPDLYGCVPWEFESGFFSIPTDIQYVTEEEIQEFDDKNT